MTEPKTRRAEHQNCVPAGRERHMGIQVYSSGTAMQGSFTSQQMAEAKGSHCERENSQISHWSRLRWTSDSELELH